MKSKRKTAIIAITLSLIALVMLCTTVFTYAYYLAGITVYTNDGNKQYARLGMNLSLLFDRLDPDALTEENLSLKILKQKDAEGNVTYYEYDPERDWGSAYNPYIISDIRHLQNLSVLWGIGYFNDTTDSFDGSPESVENSRPYFLICNPNGTPATINGTGVTIAPIGDSEKPFVGYVGGAFIEGKTKVGGNSPETGLNSDVSAIYNLKVQCTDDRMDVGLFGTVGFNGDDTDFYDEEKIKEEANVSDLSQLTPEQQEQYLAKLGSFIGANSTIRDLLLYDVQIVVEEPTWLDTLADLIAGHTRMNYPDNKADDPEFIHENHHIGILAGHIEYTTVEYISVYYSDDNLNAFDIAHKKSYSGGGYANYYSESGILGRIYQMNPLIGNGYITPNATSDSGGTIGGGNGTGGGLFSGTGRGYVTASDVFGYYNDSGNIVNFTTPGSTVGAIVERTGLLVIKQQDGTYTLKDGTTAEVSIGNRVSFVDNSTDFWGRHQESRTSWTDFVIQDGSNYYYHGLTDENHIASNVKDSGIVIRYGAHYNKDSGEYEDLCTQWVRERLLFGTQNTDSYFFTDGVFTFALSSKEDTIEPTWKGDKADKFYVGSNNPNDWEKSIPNDAGGIVAYIHQIKNNSDLATAASQGKPLVIMADAGDGQHLLMTLNKESIGTDPSNANGKAYSFVPLSSSGSDDEIVDLASMIAGYQNGSLTLDKATGGTEGPVPYTTEEMIEILKGIGSGNDWQAVYIGAAGDSEGLNTLKRDYKIRPINTSSNYYVFVDNDVDGAADYSGIQVNSDMQSYGIPEAVDAGAATWTGGYFYIDISGSSAVLKHSSSNRSLASSTDKNNAVSILKGKLTATSNQYGQTVYTYPKGNNQPPYTGILLMYDGTDYFLENGTGVTTNNGTATNAEMFEYIKSSYRFTGAIYRKMVNGQAAYYYYVDGTNDIPLRGEPTPVGTVGTATDNGTYYVEYRGIKDSDESEVFGAYLEQFNNFQFGNYIINNGNLSSNKTQYMVHYHTTRSYGCGSTTTNYYTLYCGDNPGTSIPQLVSGSATFDSSSSECAVDFTGDADGSCTIRYTMDGYNRYITKNDSNTGFTAGLSSSSKLYIYVMEVTQVVEYSYIKFLPKDGTGAKLSADEYVLWPDYSAQNYTAAATGYTGATTQDPNYYLVNVHELPLLEHTYYGKTSDTIENGWNGSDGQSLTYGDLNKIFRMKESMTFGATISVGGRELNSDGFITTAVGSLGTEANIPKGAVAFRVNKSNPNGYYIRVIVAVPTTEYYREDPENNYPLTWAADYYLGVWQMEAAGESLYTTFESSNTYAKIELPRSNTYKPRTGPDSGNSNYTNVYYNMDKRNVDDYSGYTDLPATDGTDTYRSYLNGSRVLVAYAFRIKDEGVYVLGTACSDRSHDFPMEIAFFSVDATASEGQDGIQGSKLGSIDFVYDNGEDILTVKKTSADGGITDYNNYYYASLCTLFTDNQPGLSTTEEICVNDFTGAIRRKIEPESSSSVICLNTTRSDETAIKFRRYTKYS
ncbi:MAG: hypothetical protein MJ082_00740, partial [Clostridia bacterium]|nr:hypothetical protein [Clostridia bacterium]